MAIGLLDQLASSAGNFILVFLLAQQASPREFGVLLLGYGVVTFAVTCARAALGSVIALDFGSASPEARATLVSRSTAASLVLSLPVAGALISLSLAFDSSLVTQSLVAMAVATPALLVQDILRYVAIADGRPSRALWADGLWTALATGAWVAFLIAPADTLAPQVGAWVWAMGSLLAMVMLSTWYPHRPQFSDGLFSWIRSDVRRLHLSADAALTGGAPLANSSLVSALANPSLVGGLRGAGTLFGPVNVLASGVTLALIPEARRRSDAQGSTLLNRALGVMAALTILWGVALQLIPQGVGNALLGSSWETVRPILWITTVEYLALIFWILAAARMKVFGLTRTLMKCSAGYCVLLATISPAVAWYTQSVEDTAMATALLAVGLGIIGTCLASQDLNMRGRHQKP